MKKYFILLCILHSFLSTSEAVTCNPSDSLQLVLLHNATNGPNWTMHWDLSQRVEAWVGVTLNQSGRVVYLNLSARNIQGVIPNLVLAKLQHLYLYNNHITGIPSFTHLPILQILVLEENNITNLPNFSNQPKLEQLNLRHNLLTGNTAFTNMPLLKTLNLQENSLATVPIFDNLLVLESLELSNNALVGAVPDIGGLANLRNLDLHNNLLTGSIPDLQSMPLLVSLYLDNNQLSGSIPNFGNLKKVQNLILNNNLLTGSIPNLDSLTHLEFLYLDHNLLTGSIPGFTNQASLMYLQLNHNQLTGSIPSLSNSPNLLGLYLSYNQLSGSIPGFVNNSNLQRMNLDHNQLTGSIPSFANHPFLQLPNLQSNKLTFDGLEAMITNVPSVIYAPQFPIPTARVGNIMSVNPCGSTANNTYQWYKNGTIIPGANTATFAINGSGTYNCKISNSIATQLTLVSSNIVYTCPPTVNILITPANPAICVGASTTLTATGGVSYAWSGGNGTVLPPNRFQVTPTETTTYTVVGTNLFGCTGSRSVAVTVKPIPAFSMSPAAPTICQSASIVLSGIPGTTAPATWNWVIPPVTTSLGTDPSLTVAPTITTTYRLTGTLNGCSRFRFVKVTVITCQSGPDGELETNMAESDERGAHVTEDLTIVPNPNNGLFQITLGQNQAIEHIKIVDLSGKIVYSKVMGLGSTANEVDASQLAAGLYILRVRGDGVQVNAKIVIE